MNLIIQNRERSNSKARANMALAMNLINSNLIIQDANQFFFFKSQSILTLKKQNFILTEYWQLFNGTHVKKQTY